ncbi:uncharacterized protein AKAW2_80524A [Aspergillus luchuensis]|uniref:Uncharacterized protein n=1 Tax=Aspergillus kawachii TaxID=1069201 RepID=A0A7R7WKK8_ASPKA|nr:uncharacterized protein AKAW2_80524A [Aspergillus luchuensis]BCS04723.1 hypothetical protein AKAW2_80524A [Aspergillus luchuensis]
MSSRVVSTYLPWGLDRSYQRDWPDDGNVWTRVIYWTDRAPALYRLPAPSYTGGVHLPSRHVPFFGRVADNTFCIS